MKITIWFLDDSMIHAEGEIRKVYESGGFYCISTPKTTWKYPLTLIKEIKEEGSRLPLVQRIRAV